MNKKLIPTFLKWAGGKRRLLSQIDENIDFEFNNYYEPFLGGGSVFFHIMQKYSPKKCVLSDMNKDLVNTYVAVRDKPHLIIKYLKEFENKNCSEFYYKIRNKYNQNIIKKIRRYAAFIYLNKTCYNGLYRVNSKNKFNVPYGKNQSPEIVNKQKILQASHLLKNAKILHQDYRKILKIVKENDFIYLDPCYDPLTKTSFVNYTPECFCENDRYELAKFIEKLENKNAKVILSNNDLPEIRKIYSNRGFQVKELLSSRTINSVRNKRGHITELLIKN